jgi:hypothetical protein
VRISATWGCELDWFLNSQQLAETHNHEYTLLMTKKSSLVRVQLDMSAEEAESLDTLRETCGLRSRSDAVRLALAVIDWVHRESRCGRKVVAFSDEIITEFVMPGITTFQREKR